MKKLLTCTFAAAILLVAEPAMAAKASTTCVVTVDSVLYGGRYVLLVTASGRNLQSEVTTAPDGTTENIALRAGASGVLLLADAPGTWRFKFLNRRDAVVSSCSFVIS